MSWYAPGFTEGARNQRTAILTSSPLSPRSWT
jgi:hypothetical protein